MASPCRLPGGEPGERRGPAQKCGSGAAAASARHGPRFCAGGEERGNTLASLPTPVLARSIKRAGEARKPHSVLIAGLPRGVRAGSVHCGRDDLLNGYPCYFRRAPQSQIHPRLRYPFCSIYCLHIDGSGVMRQKSLQVPSRRLDIEKCRFHLSIGHLERYSCLQQQ